MRCTPPLCRAVLSLLLGCFLLAGPATAQRAKADSLMRLLAEVKTDTDRVLLLSELSNACNIYNPDTSLQLSQQALFLAREIKFNHGLSLALGTLANAALKVGNYPRALDLYFQKLRIEEQRNTPAELASVLMNIGVVYDLEEEYSNSIDYYRRAAAVAEANNVPDIKHYIQLNMGDVFNRLNQSDSSFHYFSSALAIATQEKDAHIVAAAQTGLGHAWLKLGDTAASRDNYLKAIAGLEAVNDDAILCEATLGLANLYQHTGKRDSANWYAQKSLVVARTDGFLSNELDAADFLTHYYRSEKNIDSAFAYVNIVQALNDSINSKSRIRATQMLSMNEQMRQNEMEESRKLAAQERRQQLQWLFIGFVIPGLFLFTLLLSRIRLHTRIVKVMGIISLLTFFEYLTLLLHPYVVELTHHTPVFEILIFVAVAALLVPTHHRIEHWLIEKLIIRHREKEIKLHTKRIKLKSPSAGAKGPD